MTRTLAVCVFLAGAMTLCAPLLVRAEEQPCRAVADTVVCQREGFDKLVGKLLDARKAAQECVLRSEASTADAAVLKARLDLASAERDKALADLAVERARPFPRQRMLAAVGLGAVAGLAGALAPSASSETGAASLLAASFASAATAVVLVLSE
jgi:hypothetical protein